MNKKEYFSKIKYYGLALLIAIVPLIAVSILLDGKVSDGVLWVITIVVCLAAFFVALILEPKIEKRKTAKLKEDKKKKGSNFDPYSD